MPRELFAAILERIQRFGVPLPLVQRGRVSRKAKNIAISDRRQLLLGYGAGKRPRSTLARGKRVGLGVQAQAIVVIMDIRF